MAHIHELIDFTVEVFIVYENKVLLRFHDKYKLWLSVGGHVELDEDPNQAAIREVKEEVGLDVELFEKLKPFDLESDKYKELIPPYFLNIHRINDTHKHVSMTFFARSNSDKVTSTYEGDKSDDWVWLTKEEIESKTDLEKQVKFYALKALEELAQHD